MPKVTVIIPCYRHAETLARALASLRAQTRPADEVIVVDDASPEGEQIRQVVAEFPGTVYLRNADNLGLAGARNSGLAKASGEIVTFLDADDEAHPQRIEWQLEQVSEQIAVACDAVRVAEGQVAPKTPFSPPGRIKTYRGVGTMIYANRLTGSSLMAHAALLRSAGAYDPRLRSCEDYDLWLRLLARGITVRRIRQPLYIYHRIAGSLSQRYLDMAHWEIEVVEKFVAAGGAGISDGLRAGAIWAVWLLRHFARAAMMSDSALRAQANENLARLERWPLLQWLVRAAAATVLRPWLFSWRRY